MKNRIFQIFWGIFFLACAGFVVADQLGVWTYKLGFWAIVGTIIFALSLIDGLVNRRITESVFSIAFLLMIFAQPLKLTHLVPWTILLAALLVSIGLEIIFRNRFHTIVYANHKIKKLKNQREKITGNIFTDTTNNENGAHVVVDQSLSDAARYIHSKNLETIDVNSRMGDVALYLDDAEAAGDQVTMNLNITMTDLTIYLPLAWEINSDLTPTFGDFEVDGNSKGGGPTLFITGRANMSDIEVKYV